MSIPAAPGRLPLVGHLVQLFARPLQFLSSLRHVGELVRVDLGSAPMIMITDAKLTRQVLLDSRTFEKGGPFFDRLSELCGESLLTSKSEPHRRQRRLIQPAFDQARMQGYSAIMAEAIDAVLGAWRDGAVVDMAAAVYDITVRSSHPTMMERLRAEVDTVLAGQEVRWDHLTKLPETQRVITEALRLYPPAWLFTRVTTEDVALGAHHLPKGTGIGCSPYLLHHNPDLFEAPDRFDPDRWLPERARTVPKEAFIPFGGGARKCIGDGFGLIEATLVLATIIARWDLHPTLDRPVQPVPRRAALTPGALPMRVRSRAHGACASSTG